MMARSRLRTLAATSGQRFDFLFVDMLVEHHKGAIVMSDEVLADGRDAEIALVARRTATSSRRAIGQLTTWRRRWAEPFLRELTSPTAQSMPRPASPAPGPAQLRTEMCTWSSWRRVGLQSHGSDGCR
jgi:uncharacterized protein (DUF305 family)